MSRAACPCCLSTCSGASSRTRRGQTAWSWNIGSSASATRRRAGVAWKGCLRAGRAAQHAGRARPRKPITSAATGLASKQAHVCSRGWCSPGRTCLTHARLAGCHLGQGRVTPAEQGEYSFAKYNKKVGPYANYVGCCAPQLHLWAAAAGGGRPWAASSASPARRPPRAPAPAAAGAAVL